MDQNPIDRAPRAGLVAWPLDTRAKVRISCFLGSAFIKGPIKSGRVESSRIEEKRGALFSISPSQRRYRRCLTCCCVFPNFLLLSDTISSATIKRERSGRARALRLLRSIAPYSIYIPQPPPAYQLSNLDLLIRQLPTFDPAQKRPRRSDRRFRSCRRRM